MRATTSHRAHRRATVVVLAGLLAGCTSEDAAGNAAQRPTPPASTPTSSESTPGGTVPTDTAASTRIQLRIGADIVTASLEDSPPAREFAAMLPLTISMHELLNQEKAGGLPRALTVDGAQRESTYDVGQIGYWSPGNDIAVIYAGGGRPIPQPGLVRLGTVDSGLDLVATAGDDFEMTIEPLS